MTETEKKHVNIPIFIPHEGCPNGCVFCNQNKITGTDLRADRDIRPEIEAALATVDKEKYDVEIAFFGGSFTGIDRSLMERLLAAAHEYIAGGYVSSVRLSTRPDYIDEEILCILSKYGVKHIELGIQSASDEVLSASKRGHTAETSRKACRLITDSHAGFVLGGQMMLGLPMSTFEAEIETAKKICEWGAKEARIYPAVVFRDTELCAMMQSGKYLPLSVSEAAERSAACYEIFLENGVKVLRVGLQSGESLSDEKQVCGGAYHPAAGELCESRVYLRIIKKQLLRKLSEYRGEKKLVIECPVSDISKAAGHKKENKAALAEFLSGAGINVKNIKIMGTSREPFTVDTKFTD